MITRVLLALTLMTVVVDGQSQPPTPRTGKRESNPPQRQPEPNLSKPTVDERGTPNAPVVVRVTKSADEAAQDQAQRQSEAAAKRWTVGLSGVTLIVLLIQSYVLWRQNEIMKTQSAIMTNQLNAATTAANAAKTSADVAKDTMVITQRPFVMGKFDVAVAKERTTGKIGGWQITPRWRNGGQRPAVRGILYGGCVKIPRGKSHDFEIRTSPGDLAAGNVSPPSTMGPNELAFGKPTTLSLEQVQEMMAGQYTIFFWGGPNITTWFRILRRATPASVRAWK